MDLSSRGFVNVCCRRGSAAGTDYFFLVSSKGSTCGSMPVSWRILICSMMPV
ncbi:hypothetical protein ACFOLD_07265 [Kocuria carniphila]|uniref:hypothetical protein n=1 Tax=Kocuria carniphila TaxID=262208 RepID=UPI0036104EDD